MNERKDIDNQTWYGVLIEDFDQLILLAPTVAIRNAALPKIEEWAASLGVRLLFREFWDTGEDGDGRRYFQRISTVGDLK